MFWLWLALILLLAAAGFGFYLLWYYCLRWRGRRTEGAAVDAFRAWLAAQKPEPVSVTADDDLTLRGTFLPRKDARGTVLLLHGCRSSWEADFAASARFLYEQGFQLLLADQRGHGRSGGQSVTYGVWERFDARAWLHFLSWRCGADHPLFLYGRSEGAAAALLCMALDPPGNVRGVVAEGAYDLPHAYVAARLRARRFPFPEELASLLSAYTTALLDFGLKDCRVLDAMRESACPVLLLHGSADPYVSASDARILRNACAAGGLMLTVDGAGHGDCWETDGAKVCDAVGVFLERRLTDTE